MINVQFFRAVISGWESLEALLESRSVAGLWLDHVANEISESAVQLLAVLGVCAVCVLEWRDVRHTVASLVYGPRLERVLVTCVTWITKVASISLLHCKWETL